MREFKVREKRSGDRKRTMNATVAAAAAAAGLPPLPPRLTLKDYRREICDDSTGRRQASIIRFYLAVTPRRVTAGIVRGEGQRLISRLINRGTRYH